MQFAEAGQIWGSKFANRKFQNHRYIDEEANRDVVIKELIPETRRGRKIIAGMIANGWAVHDMTKTWGRSMMYTFRRRVLTPEEAQKLGWQA